MKSKKTKIPYFMRLQKKSRMPQKKYTQILNNIKLLESISTLYDLQQANLCH